MKTNFIPLILMLMAIAGGAYGQATPDQTPQTDQNTQQQTAAPQNNDAPQIELSDESDSETESDTDEDSPSRFIPTEQISQDLGVSFPSDI